jgi:hypothetical protein
MKKKKAEIEKINISMWLSTGEQYCPDCHRKATHEDGYWECDICKWSITDEEADYGDGYPTLEATYEDDYFECYTSNIDEEPDICKDCGGPWPDCQSGCRLFRD